MLKCCGRPIRARRLVFADEDGLKVLKVGKCTNEACKVLVVEIENITLFGRIERKLLRGKRALRFLMENEDKIVNYKRYVQYQKNTAKGFHYSNSFWDVKKNRVVIEMRELATDRLIKREEKNLIATNIDDEAA